MPGAAPASDNDEGSTRRLISGLNRTAFDLAVYASQWKLPATTQDSLPAAGPALPDGIQTRRVPTERFQVIPSSFTELLGAMPVSRFCVIPVARSKSEADTFR